MKAVPSAPTTPRASSGCRLGCWGWNNSSASPLLADPAEDPFLWLKVLDDPKLAFLVMSPFVVVPSYQPEIPGEDEAFLDLKDPQDTLILSIVTVSGAQQATVNLKGPIVLNRRTLVAKQVIPVNAPDYSVAHPLPVQAT